MKLIFFMAADYIIHTEHKVVFSYGWGVLTFADIKDHRARLFQDAKYTADLRQIAYLSDVLEMKFSGDEIRTLAQEAVFASQSRRALIAGPLLHFGMSRMFDATSKGQNISIFRELEEATSWLDLPMEVAVKAFEEIRRANGL